MRLIDGDKFRETLIAVRTTSSKHGYDYDVEVINQIINLLDNCLIVEAEPVKHGRWIFKSRSKLINTEKLFVSSRVYTPKTLPASEYCEIPRGMYFFKKVHKEIQVPFCSRCGNRGGDNEYDISKYCSECGARMDGDNDD